MIEWGLCFFTFACRVCRFLTGLGLGTGSGFLRGVFVTFTMVLGIFMGCSTYYYYYYCHYPSFPFLLLVVNPGPGSARNARFGAGNSGERGIGVQRRWLDGLMTTDGEEEEELDSGKMH